MKSCLSIFKTRKKSNKSIKS